MAAAPGIPQFAVCALPAGQYPLGDDALPACRPAHTVTLAAFAIAETALTHAGFVPFVAGDGYNNPTYWTDAGWRWLRSKPQTEPAFWQDAAFDHALQPVVGVCWYEAAAYARWLAAHSGTAWRLPTEAEWEAAARGQSPAVELPPHSVINSAERGIGRTWAVLGTGQVAWCGARDLLGNVWEWTASRWGRNWQQLEYAYPYRGDDGREHPEGSHARVMRGGSWFDGRGACHPAQRGRYLPGSRGSNIGFRLAHSL